MRHSSSKSAFSLIELAIVISIIGLIVGGITVGQSLIRNAGLKEVMTDYALYHSAIQNFNNKYSELPGDFSRAESMWGQAAAGAACKTTASTGVETCNGDGDGSIEFSGVTNSAELWRFWQHLSNAGLIEGQYTGASKSGAPNDFSTDIGVNAPSSSIANAGWSIYIVGDGLSGNPWMFDGDYGNVLMFGRPRANDVTQSAALTPEEAKGIDDKLDDGLPGDGKVVVWKNIYNPDCATTDVVATAVYELDNTSEACALIFKTGF